VTHDIHSIEIRRRRAIENESAEILADEAADVEQGGAGLQARDDGVVGGGFGDHGVEERAHSGAWVWTDCPGFVALREELENGI